VGQKQKKIDISIPKLDDFLHKVYIQIARKLYKNVYLFESGLRPLDIQKNQRELEILVQQAILDTVRESIPVEALLRAYMDETEEEEVKEEIKEIEIPDPNPAPSTSTSPPTTNTPSSTPSNTNTIPSIERKEEEKEPKQVQLDDLTFPELTKEPEPELEPQSVSMPITATVSVPAATVSVPAATVSVPAATVSWKEEDDILLGDIEILE
jgi:hypothetical protein